MVSNNELAARRKAAVSGGVASSTAVYADRALNAELWDVEGRRYVDFATGIAVLNVGHRHPKIMAAVKAQLDRFTHTAFQAAPYETYIELAERLNKLAPFSGPAKSIFLTTGAEAVENAIKIARAATGRHAVLSFSGGFHGRTFLTMAMTGKVAPYKRAFGIPAPAVFHIPFPVEADGVTVEDSLMVLDHIFASDVEPAAVAAIVIEPVQGEGGIHPAPKKLLQALRTICDTHGIALVADEIQCGIARSGRMFAIEHSGVEPDLVTIAKGIGGGLPLSGVIGRAALMDAVEPGGLGGTYGGSPVACAAALAVLDVIADEDLCARATAIGQRVRARFAELAKRNDIAPVSELRGFGAMIGFDVLQARGGAPDGALAKKIRDRALQEGVIVLGCGHGGETIRLLPPLTASDAIMDEGLAMLEKAMRVSA